MDIHGKNVLLIFICYTLIQHINGKKTITSYKEVNTKH